MTRKGSSNRWLKEHHADPYVKRARQEGYRARSVFKLEQIQKRDRLLRPGMTVVDLGAAPGGWTQFAVNAVGDKGKVVALDVLPMAPIGGVRCLQGDFCEQAVVDRLQALLEGCAVDLVMSDMAPNISGMRTVDQARAMHLAELALDFAKNSLTAGGALLIKMFQGEGFDDYLRDLRQVFARVVTRKPQASRARSRELYLLARDYRL